MKLLHWLTKVLVIVGALNWGLVGLFDFNLVTAILGMGSMLSRLVYILVGVSGLYCIFYHCKKKCCCGSESCGCNCCKDKRPHNMQ